MKIVLSVKHYCCQSSLVVMHLSLLCRHAVHTGDRVHVPHIHHCGACFLPLVDFHWKYQLQLLLCPDTGLLSVTGTYGGLHVYVGAWVWVQDLVQNGMLVCCM